MKDNAGETMKCPPELQQCLKVVFDLSQAKTQVMYYLCNKTATTKKVAEDLDKDPSTIRRYLKELRDLQLIERSTRSTNTPGPQYEYNVADKQGLKERVARQLNEWRDQRLNDLEQL